MKKVIIMIVAAIMAMNLTACGNVEIEPTETTVRGIEVTETKEEIEKSLFNLYEIGAISFEELKDELNALYS